MNKVLVNPARKDWADICKRPAAPDDAITGRVRAIIERVKDGGDEALRELAMEIDGRAPQVLAVSAERIGRAAAALPAELKEAIALAAANIKAFHQAQMPRQIEVETAPGVKCIQKPVPIEKVGLYIPGGTAPLFSTVLMLAIPAKLAGCSKVVLCTPAGKDGEIAPAVLYAASVCGVDQIFEAGGAQAVAAMAYGTESIPKVDKIFGPGNRYVTTAKQIVGGNVVAIDMPAGPSEVMVIADESADPAFVAADLLSQAEHGRDSQVVLVCNSENFASRVQDEIERQLAVLSREDFARGALDGSRFVVLTDEADIVDFADCYAPEHLIVNTTDPWSIAGKVKAAGSVFVGAYTPESAGDYASGTNHTLPTCAWARSFSGVNIDSYMRKMTIQEISRDGLKGLASTIIGMAEAEGLQAHANAVKTRLDD